MYYIYILYSPSSGKTYTGFTNNVNRRLTEHNFTETKGFTLRYRPWKLIHTEEFPTKHAATAREKILKSGKGREEIKSLLKSFLHTDGAVSAAAEKD